VVGLGGLAAAVLAIPFLGVITAPVRRRAPNVWRRVGPLEAFAQGATVAVAIEDADVPPWTGPIDESPVLLRRVGAGQFIAFSAYRTPVGCPVRWVEGAQMFMCPCRGGIFDRDGKVTAGPPPRPLERHQVRLRDGQVEVLTRMIQLRGRGVATS
jgi:menaquinol-cytochrome c reductase iron-sulfur subunit